MHKEYHHRLMAFWLNFTFHTFINTHVQDLLLSLLLLLVLSKKLNFFCKFIVNAFSYFLNFFIFPPNLTHAYRIYCTLHISDRGNQYLVEKKHPFCTKLITCRDHSCIQRQATLLSNRFYEIIYDYRKNGLRNTEKKLKGFTQHSFKKRFSWFSLQIA